METQDIFEALKPYFLMPQTELNFDIPTKGYWSFSFNFINQRKLAI